MNSSRRDVATSGQQGRCHGLSVVDVDLNSSAQACDLLDRVLDKASRPLGPRHANGSVSHGLVVLVPRLRIGCLQEPRTSQHSTHKRRGTSTTRKDAAIEATPLAIAARHQQVNAQGAVHRRDLGPTSAAVNGALRDWRGRLRRDLAGRIVTYNIRIAHDVSSQNGYG